MKIYGDKIYEQQFSSKGWGKYPSEEVIRFFMRKKAKFNSSKISALDIGCGIGSCSWFMAKEGANVTAMDGSPSGLNLLKTIVKEFGVGLSSIKTVHGDITKPLDYLNMTYNIMIDNYSLYSNKEENTIRGFRDLYKLLSDDGYLMTCCFGKKTDGFGTGTKISKNTFTNIKGVLSNGGIQTFFDRDYLNTIFQNVGYNIDYYENIIENRNGEIIEKHITYLSK